MRRLLPLAAGVLAAGAVLGVLALDGDGGAAPRATTAPAPEGGSVFARMGCGGCHTFAAAHADGQVGPDLDTALAGYDRAALTRQIVDPTGSGGFATMPTDFGERMSAAELAALVAWLLDNRSG